MSRHSQLPPRCPLQKKTSKSPYQCDPDEQPEWLNDLLCDSDSNSDVKLHCRTVSDTSTLFGGLDQLDEMDGADSSELPDVELGSSCNYGPNSPRRRSKLGLPEKEIVSAFSGYIMQNPLQHLDGYNSVSGSDLFGEASSSAGEINAENKPMKRHPGQRSRARKLQYISELEKTVDILQNLGSELSVRVSSLLQQYASLSMENSTLKQQLMSMQREKFFVDGEYQTLKKEVDKLKTGLALRSNNKVHNRHHISSDLGRSDAVWAMLDLQKLDLN